MDYISLEPKLPGSIHEKPFKPDPDPAGLHGQAGPLSRSIIR